MRAQAVEKQAMSLLYPNWISNKTSICSKKKVSKSLQNVNEESCKKLNFGCRRTGSISLALP